MTKSIRLENIKKTYDGQAILEDLNLTIPSGQFFALLGPSGCGKTTILRLIAGFESVDNGHIFLGDQEITHAPINKRRINTVFQNYALFPHLNVFDNVAYSQRIKGVSPEIIEQRVIKMLNSVHLEQHMFKSIHQLSGGQKQRVALARAVINQPDVLLLDEPLAALDLKLREKMLLELIELQSNLQTTFVYVTHDQFEALTVADQMAIMNHDGAIEQIGTPKEIYEFPVSTFVAKFVGTTNLLQGKLEAINGQEVLMDVDQLAIVRMFVPEKKDWMVSGRKAYMSVRPEKILIAKQSVQGFANQVKGIVESIVYHGRSTQYNVRLANDYLMQVFEQNEEHFAREVIDYGHEVFLHWQKENAVLLER
ncbi:MAG TPA: ABC transporter ATP-binding protein [Candidatus Babeliales bacterium]|nr:ABC transporter ATP-binding protein [Candidatus Babeliales bacterium]